MWVVEWNLDSVEWLIYYSLCTKYGHAAWSDRPLSLEHCILPNVIFAFTHLCRKTQWVLNKDGGVICVIDHASSQLNVTCCSTFIGRLDIFWSSIQPRMALIDAFSSSKMICWHGMKMLQTNTPPKERWISRRHLLWGRRGNANLGSKSLLWTRHGICKLTPMQLW